MECGNCGAQRRAGSQICLACGELAARRADADVASPSESYCGRWGTAARPVAREPAGYVVRWLAYVVDSVISLALVAVAFLAWGLADGRAVTLGTLAGRDGFAALVTAVGVQWLYFALFESSVLMGTPGKRLFGLVVTDEAGGQLGLVHTLGRAAAKALMVGLVPFTLFIAFFSSRRQTLYDLLLGTVVTEDDGPLRPTGPRYLRQPGP